ncbi:T-complex protein 11-like protein 2 [Eucyclogobius newberryi]|uniref:T-complex protein 11-like protein 2 n=1 Tax=Eucyclogobius newberryi TaxID=166745 RepID=UPI003B5BEE88
MPLNNERPGSISSGGEDQGSDVESSSERCDSFTSASDLDCSQESFTSNNSSKQCTPSSSPPKVLTLDEVMDSARDLSNLSLAHEIIVNPNFHFEANSTPQDSIFQLVKENLHKAFWDILEAELNDDPPAYGQAIMLLGEIRETMLSFLNPGANRMRTQIMEVLDIDLIRQQAANDVIDIQGLASYIITTMGKLCAPSRDEEIKKLRQNTENVVTLFREIFRVLDLMKADMVNVKINHIRPMLLKQSVEYERAKFQSILDKTPKALDNTTQWIKCALEDLQSATSSSEEKQTAVPGPFQVLNMAFLHVLTWDHNKKTLPETLMTDEGRLREIQEQLQQCQAVNEVLLIVYSTIGGPIQGLPPLAERLKRMTIVLLDGMHRPDFNLEETLQGVSAQICCELNKSLTERGYSALTPALLETLTGQICCITQNDNPIRTLVEDRVQQYFKMLICDAKPQGKLEHVPAGLTIIKHDLMPVAARFLSLVNYNKTVYGPYYADIIRKLMFSNGPSEERPTEGAVPNTAVSK